MMDAHDRPATAGRLLLRPAEAAQALGISRSRCYELLAAGVLPSVRIGGSVRVPVDQLHAWIAAHTRAGVPINDDHAQTRTR